MKPVTSGYKNTTFFYSSFFFFFISEQAIDLKTLLVLSQDDVKEPIPIIGHRALFTAPTNAFEDVINSPVIMVSFILQ